MFPHGEVTGAGRDRLTRTRACGSYLLPVVGGAEKMRSSAGLPPLLLPLLLLSGRAAFTACRSLNAAQDRRVSAPDGTDGLTTAAAGNGI